MNKLDINLDKIITSFDEVQEVLDKIESKIDEPGLKDKKVTRYVGSEGEIIEIMDLYSSRMAENITEDQFKYVSGFYLSDKGCPSSFRLAVKQNNFPQFFMAYFHELGHIANHEFNKIKLPQLEKVVINESLAESFAYWAVEEFNKIYSLQFKDRRIVLSEDIEYQELPENFHKTNDERRILTKFLLEFNVLFKSPKKVYSTIKKLAYKTPEALAEMIKDYFVCNK